MRLVAFAAVWSQFTGCSLGALVTRRASWPDRMVPEAQEVGVGGPVSIARDAVGIPHIRATTDEDAMFALGWVHAEDRLFQMDLTRRFAWGSLGEIAGSDLDDLDVVMRLLDLRTRARLALEAADPETRALLESYTRGVNARLERTEVLPVEHRLVGVEVSPWAPEDCLSLVFLNAWLLATNAGHELAALAFRDLPDEAQAALLVSDPASPPVDPSWFLDASYSFGPVHPGFEILLDVAPEEPAASNNWAIGPSRSANGGAWLASDPHLLQRVPSLWYIAELRGASLHLAGATLPGAPMIVIGHNGSVAWGLTNLMADTVDLAIVERVGATGYRLEGEVRSLEAVEIRVEGRRPSSRTLYRTDIGPVLTELDGTHLLVLRWSALSVEDRTADLFAGLARASTVQEAIEAVDEPSIVAQQAALADVAGHVALAPFGSIVARRGFSGRVPHRASELGVGWGPFVEAPPAVVDPVDHIVASANAPPAAADPYAVSTAFDAPWRLSRVRAVLSELDRADFDDLRALQLDRWDGEAAAALPEILRGVAPSTPAAETCAHVLRGWDAVAEPWSVGATVYYRFGRELLDVVLADELGEALPYARRIVEPGSAWASGRLDPFIDGPRAAIVDRALNRTCAGLVEDLGPDPAEWAWGTVHRLHLEHPFAGASPLLRRWSMDDVPYGGSGNTVNAAGFPSQGPFATTWMASLRFVIPLADPAAAQIAHPGGQSGHPGEPGSRDGYASFVAGAYQPLWFDDADVIAHTIATERLVP